MARDTCKGTRDDGEPCTSPIVGKDGYCPAHREGARDRLSAAGKKGGQATARRFSGGGLDEDELPPLTSPQNAETWCDVVGRAVVTGRIGHNEAKAALRAVREWRESRDAGELDERVEELEEKIEKAKGKMEVVK